MEQLFVKATVVSAAMWVVLGVVIGCVAVIAKPQADPTLLSANYYIGVIENNLGLVVTAQFENIDTPNDRFPIRFRVRRDDRPLPDYEFAMTGKLTGGAHPREKVDVIFDIPDYRVGGFNARYAERDVRIYEASSDGKRWIKLTQIEQPKRGQSDPVMDALLKK